MTGPLLDIEDVGDPTAVAQTNFEEIDDALYEFSPSKQNGVETTIIGPPTTGAHVLDERWRDAWNGEWRCTVAGTPGTWQQERAAVRAGEPSTGTIPTGYLIEDSTASYQRKVHVGAYVWRAAAPNWYSSLSLLTGGTSTSLDAISTTSLLAGTIAAFIYVGRFVIYQLTNGTDAELSPFLIRPDDFNAATNAKVWQRVAAFDYPASNLYRDLTGLTGSTTSDLNGIPTLSLSTGQVVWFTVSGSLVAYRLRSGTDATASPTVIRPVDFQSVSNAKVWERVFICAAPGDVLIANNNLSELATSTTKRAAARANLDVPWSDDVRGWISNRAPRGGLYCDGTASNLLSGTSGINLSTSDFSLAVTVQLQDYTPSTAHTLFTTHSTGNNRIVLLLDTLGRFVLRFVDSGGTSTDYNLPPDVALVDGEVYQVVVAADRDGLATLYINGISDRDKGGSGVTASISGSSAVDIGSGNANAYAALNSVTGIVYSLRCYNYALSAASILILGQTSSTGYADGAGSMTNIIDGSTLNGGFETAGGGGADVFANWTEATGGTSSVNRDTVVFHSGAASLRFDLDSSASLVQVSQASITIGRRYRVTYWAKASQDAILISVGRNDGSNQKSLTTSWVQYTTEFVADVSSFVIKRVGGSGASQSIWIDDVTVTPIGSIVDLELDWSAPAQSLAVRDRTANANHATASASGITQVNRQQQLNPVRISVGSSTVKTKELSATATLDFGSINAAASADLTITVTGAAVGDSVSLGLPSSWTSGIIYQAFVSASNTVTVRATNVTGSPIDPASATFRATVFQYA